jgi:hypothetical protein
LLDGFRENIGLSPEILAGFEPRTSSSLHLSISCCVLFFLSVVSIHEQGYPSQPAISSASPARIILRADQIDAQH